MSCPHGNPIGGCDTCDEVDAAFDAGKRSALAEQQEPVAKDNSNYRLDPPGLDPRYTSPPAQRKPLTKTKVGNFLRRHAHGEVSMYRNGFKDGVAFAEAAHGIKENT